MNHLIAGLPPKERLQVLRLSKPVHLAAGEILCEADEPIQHAHFPVTGLIALVAVTRDHPPLGMAMVGNEGLVGGTLAWRINRPQLRAVVQCSGAALCVTAAQMRLLARQCPAFLRALQLYSYSVKRQIYRTATCNTFHDVETRLARWLLMTSDRGATPVFELTHQTLADLLGVQRSAITISAGVLQRKGLIGYARGRIKILSRAGLEAAACECYEAQVKETVQEKRKVRRIAAA